jgi:arylsulfatase A-like enzyme
LAPDFLAYVAVACAAGWVAALAVGAVRKAASGSSKPHGALGALVGLAVFFAVVGAHEIVTKTVMYDTMSGRLKPSPAHVVIAALAGAGTLLSLLAFQASLRMKSQRSALVAALMVILGALAAAAAGSADGGALAAGTSTRNNVVLITIDTLRADHLSCYGHARQTSPNIDRLAADGILYENAVSQAPNTHPSMGSMVTSELPSRLGDRYFKYVPYGIPTLAEAFLNAGYRTGAVVSNVWLKSGLGFDQGFDDYDQSSAMSEFYADGARTGWRNAADVSDAALGWLAKATDQPFFLWLHYLDPHHPYDAPAPYDKEYGLDSPEASAFLAELRAMDTADQTRHLTDIGCGHTKVTDGQFDAILASYDAEIRFTDAQIGRVLDALREHGLFDKTIVALTADHGEEFRDHDGWGHAHTLYNELLHVPLVVRYPDGPRGRREKALAGVYDVAPTVLAACGIPVPRSMRGTDLRTAAAAREIASVLTRKGLYAVQDGEWKLITSKEEKDVALFRLSSDPHEKTNVAATYPEQASAMLASLETVMGSAASNETESGAARTLDAKAQEQLRALGYLE